MSNKKFDYTTQGILGEQLTNLNSRLTSANGRSLILAMASYVAIAPGVLHMESIFNNPPPTNLRTWENI